MITRSLVLILIYIAIPASCLAEASNDEVHPWLTDDFLISVGGYLPQKNIRVSARGTYEDENLLIDFDEAFNGGDQETVAAIAFHWRTGEKWSVSADSYGTRFSEGTELLEDKEWNGYIFPAGSYAQAGFSTDLYRIQAGRRIYQRPNQEIGIGFGIHWLDLGAFIEGEARINNETTGVRKETVRAGAPLPNLNTWFMHSWSQDWVLFASVDWFSASIKEYSGTMWDLSAGVNYQATEHFGLGLSYKHFVVDLDVEKRGWLGRVKYSHSGPFLALTGNW